ncbi:hypothetical protein PN498_20495 [Oscillatoria sp. CS-180]|uniref:ribonuclease toxin HepT-like protein n=1 Tax=Oscillatoria sp. CS-180 TaxID=3021720 RepID=UPI00232B2209|nr:hypothetical protein [Oscillatoria sp. CS-180]MDB9528383.1 hypothetical protein [Oscillatoria sp. CS-180]
MEKYQAAGLAAELKAQLRLFERVQERLQERVAANTETSAQLDSIALQIHNLYCAAEDLMKLIAQSFENRIGSGVDWHCSLLLRMSEPVPGIRPALLSEDLFDIMNRLRGFRHFVRHAYVTDIDAAQLQINLAFAVQLTHELPTAVHQFIGQLEDPDFSSD